jgi:protein phosphatase 1 regulatory subunit 42
LNKNIMKKTPAAAAHADRAAASASSASASGSGRTLPAASAAATRAFAAAGPKPEVVPNPLQAIVPPIIAAVGGTVRGLQKGLPAAASAALTSGAARSAVAFFADRALLSGYFLAVEHLDLPKWAAFLASGGYADRAGWGKIVEAARAPVAAGSLTAEEAESLVASLHSADVYDQALFSGLAAILRAKFTEASTEGLCAAIAAFAENGHFDQGLWDDAADAISYCNHYLAPTKVPVGSLAAVLAAYAKYGVDRADLFVCLSRAVSEDRLRPLPDGELGRIASSLLASFKALDFWPDVTEALVLAARVRPGVSVDAALVEHAARKLAASSGGGGAAAGASAPAGAGGGGGGGGSPWLEGGYKDAEHFHGKPFGEYNMYVLRDELTPKYYSPAAARADVVVGK